MKGRGREQNGEPRTKRMGLLCQHFYPELISTGMHMTELALALKGEGWDIVVYCAQPSAAIEGGNARVPSEMVHEGIRVRRVSAFGSHRKNLIGRLVYGSTYILAVMWRVIRDGSGIDVLLVTTNPSVLGLVGRVVAAVRGVPYVVVVYDVYPDVAVRLGLFRGSSPFVWCWDRLVQAGLHGATALVVIGRDMRDLVARKLEKSAPPLYLIPNWSDENTVRPVPPERNAFRKRHVALETFVVQYSGNMALTHNLEPLVRAADILRKEPVLFQFIGDGAKKSSLMRFCNDRGLTNVQFLPYQPRIHLNEVLSAADLSVVCLGAQFTGVSVPSKTYGIMASGRPILGFVAKESEIGQTIRERECGLVLEEPDGNTVAAVIQELRQSAHTLQRWGENGYRAFRQHYTLSSAAKRYSELLHQVASRDGMSSVPCSSVERDSTQEAAKRCGVFKRLFDIGLAGLGLFVSSPLWLCIAALIKLEDRGPVFYRQVRMGKEGTHFTVLKFRSMIPDAEQKTGAVWASEDDPRVTRLGRWLRASALDELPQLLSILRGDMSFVGPRPERPELAKEFSRTIPGYYRRLRVQPGLTGLAQVCGSYDTPARHKLRYDLLYVSRRCFWLDLKLILLSFWITFRGKWESRAKKY